jgi:hypothetical protein
MSLGGARRKPIPYGPCRPERIHMPLFGPGNVWVFAGQAVVRLRTSHSSAPRAAAAFPDACRRPRLDVGGPGVRFLSRSGRDAGGHRGRRANPRASVALGLRPARLGVHRWAPVEHTHMPVVSMGQRNTS